MAIELGLVELASRALTNLGLAKTQALDLDGAVADLEQSLELARSVSSPEEARARHNLGSATFFRGDLTRATEQFAEAAALAERFGIAAASRSRAAPCSAWALYHTGAWEEALRIADELIAQLERGGASYFEYHLRYARARIGLARAADDELALPDAGERSRSAARRRIARP